jgi:hypothetical protein
MIENRQAGSRATTESQAISLIASLVAAIRRFRIYPAEHQACMTAVEKQLENLRVIKP